MIQFKYLPPKLQKS